MNEVLDKYQEAIHYLNQNDFVKAEEFFIELLKENQNDFDALNYVGIINLHNRRFEEAAKYFQKAYELNPLHSVTLYNLGLANQYLREYEKAETNYKTLLELEPEHIDGLNNLGLINLHKENFDEAEKLFLDVLKLEHEHNETLINLGNLKFKQEKYDEAISYYTRVLESDSQNLLCIYNLGNAYLKKEDYDLAVQYFDYTIKLDPNHTGAMNNLGIINTKKKQYEKAEGFYKKVLKLSPGNFETMFNLAQCFEENSKYLEAANIYNSLLKIEPQNNAVILNLVGINYKLGNKSFSNELMNKVANDDSTKFALITNLGISKMRLGKVDDAIELWHKALEIDPNSPDANYNLGHANLLKGNFVEGWKGYEWRKKRKNFIELKFHEPELTNQDVNGKTILVYDEQGLGDSIQFVRYLQLLKEKGAKIVYAYDKRLAQIFKNITWIDSHVPRQNFDGVNLSFDYHISLLSLPLYFKTNIKTIPSNIPYIFADRSVVKQLSPIIRKNKKFNIGIVWAGNPNNTNDKYRSSSLSEFSHLCSIDGVQLYSMQKGFGLEQLEQENLPIVNLEKHGINSFAHNMAIIENLDLVISVDTSIAHLAGAMGKPVWVILPFLPDWRWMLNRSDTPWYPTMKLFRQKTAGDWKGVFEEVINELQNLINGNTENPMGIILHSIYSNIIPFIKRMNW